MNDSTSTSCTPMSLRGDREALTIEWGDGVTHRLTWQMLRDNCPCATCRTKRNAPAPAGEPPALLPILRGPAEAEAVYGQGMEALGNYAYQISFSDGHGSGIYSLELLRALGNGPLGRVDGKQ